MKILSTRQIRELDNYTIENESITSVDLMERAASAFTEWYVQHYDESHPVYIICGPGNNGGDGLAVARLLEKRFYAVQVYLLLFSDKTSNDFQVNLKRLQTNTDVPVKCCHHRCDIGFGIDTPRRRIHRKSYRTPQSSGSEAGEY